MADDGGKFVYGITQSSLFFFVADLLALLQSSTVLVSLSYDAFTLSQSN